jgi:hypothetical protein
VLDRFLAAILLEQVRHPERQAVHDGTRARWDRGQRAGQVERRLDGRPAERSLPAVAGDALGHLGVARLGCRHEHDGPAEGPGAAQRERGLAAARAADQQRQRHQKSIPRLARTPRS